MMTAQLIQKLHLSTYSNLLVQQIQERAKHHFERRNSTSIHQIVPTIESIATGTPENIVRQSEAASVVAQLPALEHQRDRIEKIYRHTQIDTRHLAIDLLSDQAIAEQQNSTIQSRMELYQEKAVPLAEKVASRAIAAAAAQIPLSPDLGKQMIKDAIHLVVFVSSTGFVAPGVDAELIERLGLKRNTARATVNFMGCAAAMNGLRIACDHVRAYPTHKVLLVCLELSSVNAVFNDDINDIIIHSIFGDGCAAVVIGACDAEQSAGTGQIVIRDHLSYLVENTKDGIVLGVHENGITCRLSRQLPDYIETGVGPVIEGFLADHQLTKAQIDLWAIHPGGTRIIQKAQQALGLDDRQVADSWEVLRLYGNMLSPSVLFVMERMLRRVAQAAASPDAPRKTEPVMGIAFSFSPGVGVEGILFQTI